MILVIGNKTFLCGDSVKLIEQLCTASVGSRNAFVQDGMATYEEANEDISENFLFNLRRKDLRE